MPIVHQKEHLSSKIAIWQITETVDELLKIAVLSDDEKVTLMNFKSESRRLEFLTVRALLKAIYPDRQLTISYNANGKPFLLEMGISISHSKDFVALLLGPFTSGGIDIEIMNDRIFTLSKKFLNAEEKAFLGELPSRESLQIVWGAKEILYKIHSIGDVDFKKDLLVHPFSSSDEGQLKASIRKPGFEKTYSIYYEKMSPFMVSWGLELS